MKHYCLINYIWNKEELPDKWKESIIGPIRRKGGKSDCNNNYRWISLQSDSYKIVSNVLLSSLSPYINEVVGDHQYGFRRKRINFWSDFLHSSDTREKMGVQWNSTSAIHRLLIDLWVPMKLVRLIKMCLNETYSQVHIGKHLSESFLIQNGLKQGDTLSLLLFDFAL
jgi:hypothetical protein